MTRPHVQERGWGPQPLATMTGEAVLKYWSRLEGPTPLRRRPDSGRKTGRGRPLRSATGCAWQGYKTGKASTKAEGPIGLGGSHVASTVSHRGRDRGHTTIFDIKSHPGSATLVGSHPSSKSATRLHRRAAVSVDEASGGEGTRSQLQLRKPPVSVRSHYNRSEDA